MGDPLVIANETDPVMGFMVGACEGIIIRGCHIDVENNDIGVWIMGHVDKDVP